MFKKQLTINIESLDAKIGKLSMELELMEDKEEYEIAMDKMKSLTELRCKLSESKVGGSLKPIVVSGLFGIASMILVLKYEETEVITSKAYSMIPSMFRGSK